METIANRVIKIVEATGGNKSEFARKINLTPAYISKLDKQPDRIPSDRTIADICREFNVSETWLRTGDGEMFEKATNTLADKLAQEYRLDNLGRQIMAAYLELDENDRLAVGHLIQNLLNKQTTPVPDASGQAQAESDLAAEIAELKRQNQALAAEIAALKEEDAKMEAAAESSAWPSVSAGSRSPADRAKK